MLEPLCKLAEKANLNININVRFEGGATIEKMENIVLDYLQKYPNDQAYFFVGVNNLTEKHRNGKVTGIFTEASNLIEIMKLKFDKAMS